VKKHVIIGDPELCLGAPKQMLDSAKARGFTVCGQDESHPGRGRHWTLSCDTCGATRSANTGKINEGSLSCPCSHRKRGPKRGSTGRKAGLLLRVLGLDRTIADCAKLYSISEASIRQRLYARDHDINGAGAWDDEQVVFGKRKGHRLGLARDAQREAQINPAVWTIRMTKRLPLLLDQIEKHFETSKRNLIATVLNPFLQEVGAGPIDMDWAPEPKAQQPERPLRDERKTWEELFNSLDPDTQGQILALLEVLPPFPLDDTILIGEGIFAGWNVRHWRAMGKVRPWDDPSLNLVYVLMEHGVGWDERNGNLLDENDGDKLLGNCPVEFYPNGP
jgi:hypothetical protein